MGGGFQGIANGLAIALGWLADETGSLSVRLALGIVLVWAGIFKLSHPAVAARAIVDFGVLRLPRPAVAIALGLSEIIIAVLVVFPAAVVVIVGCVAAVLLSLAFTVVIGRSLRRGESFPCACFSAGNSQISIVTLLRSVAMIFAGVVGGVGPSVTGTAAVHIESLVPATAIGLSLIGLPTAIYCVFSIWSTHSRFMRDVDWEWVISSRRAAQQ